MNRKRKSTAIKAPAAKKLKKSAATTKCRKRAATTRSAPPVEDAPVQVCLVERNKCTTCRHHLLHETDAEYCANPDCTRSMHRFDSFAAGFFCSYATSWKESQRKFVCAVCCIEGRRAQPPFVHPDLQYGNLELEPRQPFFPSPCSTEDERRDLAGINAPFGKSVAD